MPNSLPDHRASWSLVAGLTLLLVGCTSVPAASLLNEAGLSEDARVAAIEAREKVRQVQEGMRQVRRNGAIDL